MRSESTTKLIGRRYRISRCTKRSHYRLLTAFCKTNPNSPFHRPPAPALPNEPNRPDLANAACPSGCVDFCSSAAERTQQRIQCEAAGRRSGRHCRVYRCANEAIPAFRFLQNKANSPYSREIKNLRGARRLPAVACVSHTERTQSPKIPPMRRVLLAASTSARPLPNEPNIESNTRLLGCDWRDVPDFPVHKNQAISALTGFCKTKLPHTPDQKLTRRTALSGGYLGQPCQTNPTRTPHTHPECMRGPGCWPARIRASASSISPQRSCASSFGAIFLASFRKTL